MKAAEQGYASAQKMVGKYLENGWNCPKNVAKAKEWYQKAADKGNEDAKAALERLG